MAMTHDYYETLARVYNVKLDEEGVAMTAREMAEAAGYTSPSSGHAVLRILEAAQLIPRRKRRRPRGGDAGITAG